MTNELLYIEKEIRRTEYALNFAKKRPNPQELEIANLEKKLNILHNIRGVLRKQQEK